MNKEDMKVGDLIKIWFEHDYDANYSIPPFQGILLKTFVSDFEIYEGEDRRLHHIYVDGQERAYWDTDWMLEVISETR